MNFYIKRILPKPLRLRNSDKNETHRHTHGPREHYDDTVVIYVMIHWFYMNIKKTCHSIEKKGETKTFCNSYFVLNTFLGILSDLCCPFQSHFPDSRSRMTLFMFVRFGIQAINLFKKKEQQQRPTAPHIPPHHPTTILQVVVSSRCISRSTPALTGNNTIGERYVPRSCKVITKGIRNTLHY